MAGCCRNDAESEGQVTGRYRRILGAVVTLNGVMFAIEFGAGLAGDSMALQADALDFLGDSATYALSLAVLGRPLVVRARAALTKGLSLGALGLWVLGATTYRVFVLGQPDAFVMGTVGLLACAVNIASFLLLLNYRTGDANLRSVWLCSRNDVLANLVVVLAATGVFTTGTPWPDLIVAGIMAGLFLSTATGIVRQALGELRRSHPSETQAPTEAS